MNIANPKDFLYMECIRWPDIHSPRDLSWNAAAANNFSFKTFTCWSARVVKKTQEKRKSPLKTIRVWVKMNKRNVQKTKKLCSLLFAKYFASVNASLQIWRSLFLCWPFYFSIILRTFLSFCDTANMRILRFLRFRIKEYTNMTNKA